MSILAKKKQKNIFLPGQTFGRWKVLEKTGKPEHAKSRGGTWYLCECQCKSKTTRPVRSDVLKDGKSQSCGCLQREHAQSGSAKRTHGQTGTRLYHIWAGMKARCYDDEQASYVNYGARGIKICGDWRNSFECFRDWAISSGYKSDLTIERINVNGDYEPNNCTFVTLLEQARNKRTTVYVKAWGETKRIDEWLLDPRCKISNINTLRTRLGRNMPPEEAIGLPLLRNRN